MVINLIILALIVGVVIGLNLVALVPLFVIQVVLKFGFFRNGKLSYEKYEFTDTHNRTTTKSRYIFRGENNFKDTCTGKITVIMIAISVAILELLAVGIYFIGSH
ncbi:MAG: hypothetical protein IPM77_03995 [Crocinitomicaceae bacterium]|nr:hypothetical protein [Crocinitomicaceae bacterium]